MRTFVRTCAAALAMAASACLVPASAQQSAAPSEIVQTGQEFLKRYDEMNVMAHHTDDVLLGKAPKPAGCPVNCYEKLMADDDAKVADVFDHLRGIVRQHGWVSSAQWGDRVELAGADTISARLIALKKDETSADAVAFVKGVLPDLREGLRSRGLKPSIYASIVDDIELYEGRPQVYGSEFDCVGDKFAPYSLLEPAKVNERRAGIGLGPIEDHRYSRNTSMQQACAELAAKPKAKTE